jgi:alpha-glucoside transport system substrate-binding protein
VDVVYSGSRDFETNIRVAAEGGSLPDIALFAQPGTVTSETFVDVIAPLPDDVATRVRENFDPVWSDLVTVDGEVLAVPFIAAVKSLVWFSPKVFEERGYEVPETWDELVALQDQIRADGATPWCVGIESGEATGWPFTDWVEDVMLRLHGPEVYDEWVNHEIAFNDPRVKEAVEIVGEMWFEDDNVLGGREAIASTGFGSAGLPVLEGDCLMHRQANFFSANFKDQAPDTVFGEDGDINVFYLPTMDDEFGNVMLSAGGYAVAFNDRPATMAAMAHLVGPDYANARIRANKGGFLSPNNKHDTSLYADEIDRTMASMLAEADVVRFDASDLMPPEVGSGTFWADGTSYVSGALDADGFLNSVEESWPD